jgi:uncharacterized membrane protein
MRMGNLCFGAVVVPVVLFFGIATSGNAGWNIPSFDTQIRVNKDSSADVTETITADFREEAHHGIFRLVPVRYRDRFGNVFALRVQTLGITDENGKPLHYQTSYTKGYIKWKIGDPKRTIQNIATYKITYRVTRALGFFPEHDEIYWNATGDEWPVEILKSSATVILPEQQDASQIRAMSYTGYRGQTTSKASAQVVSGREFRFVMPEPLRPGEGLTIVAGFPKGVVPEPSAAVQARDYVFDNAGLALPIVVFLLMYWLWYKRGRDPWKPKNIVVQYQPPENLTPAEVGTLIDERVDSRDISSTVIDLAVRGFLKIEEVKKTFLHIFNHVDYTLTRLTPGEDKPLAKHEKQILSALFGSKDTVNLSDLKNELSDKLDGIKRAIYDGLKRAGYFVSSPQEVRTGYRVGGIIALVLGVILFFVGAGRVGAGSNILLLTPATGLGVFLSGIVILIFAPLMPRKTVKGAQTLARILGFEEYLKRAEAEQIKFEERKNIFEHFLPYAMSLGLAHRWAKAFQQVYTTPPSWYHADDISGFNASMFSHQLDHAAQAVSSSFAPASRGSGGSGFSGGSSGGGGGGGGGGAW